MDLKSCKSTLLIYLGYSFFLSSILGALCILIEYAPSAKHSIEKFGIGTTFLNSVLWSLLLSVTATTSLLNTYEPIRRNFILSLLCFILLPLIALITVISFIRVPADIFGFTETSIVFLIAQLFFYFRFRFCIKKTNVMAIE